MILFAFLFTWFTTIFLALVNDELPDPEVRGREVQIFERSLLRLPIN